MENILLFFFGAILLLYVLFWLGYSWEQYDYRHSKHYKTYPPVGVHYDTKKTTATVVPDPKEKEKTTFWGGKRDPVLYLNERPHPPAPLLFGRTEEGEISSEGAEEPEFLTDNEARFWHHVNEHNADFCIKTTAKIAERRAMRPK